MKSLYARDQDPTGAKSVAPRKQHAIVTLLRDVGTACYVSTMRDQICMSWRKVKVAYHILRDALSVSQLVMMSPNLVVKRSRVHLVGPRGCVLPAAPWVRMFVVFPVGQIREHATSARNNALP